MSHEVCHSRFHTPRLCENSSGTYSKKYLQHPIINYIISFSRCIVIIFLHVLQIPFRSA